MNVILAVAVAAPILAQPRVSDTVIVAIVAALSNVIALVIGMWKVNRSVESVHKTVNSRMDEMLVLAKKGAHAEGVKEGEDSKKAPSGPLTEARLIEILEARDKRK